MSLRLVKPIEAPSEIGHNRRQSDQGCVWCAITVVVIFYECFRALVLLLWSAV